MMGKNARRAGNEVPMEIRPSKEQDLPRMLEIYEYARRFMADHGNPNQWGATHWPPEQLLRRGTAFLQIQIVLHQSLQHLVPIQLADQRAGAVVVGDVGGIL